MLLLAAGPPEGSWLPELGPFPPPLPTSRLSPSLCLAGIAGAELRRPSWSLQPLFPTAAAAMGEIRGGVGGGPGTLRGASGVTLAASRRAGLVPEPVGHPHCPHRPHPLALSSHQALAATVLAPSPARWLLSASGLTPPGAGEACPPSPSPPPHDSVPSFFSRNKVWRRPRRRRLRSRARTRTRKRKRRRKKRALKRHQSKRSGLPAAPPPGRLHLLPLSTALVL